MERRAGDVVIAEGGAVARLGRYVAGRGRRHHLWVGRGVLVWPDGTEEPEREWVPNVLLDLGEQSVGDVYLREQANPSKYLALVTATPAETATMTSPAFPESETPGVDGYARQQIAAGDWAAGSLSGGDWQFVAAEKTFGPNTGLAWALDAVALVTAGTGTGGLYLAAVTTATKSVAQNGTYKFTLAWKDQ